MEKEFNACENSLESLRSLARWSIMDATFEASCLGDKDVFIVAQHWRGQNSPLEHTWLFLIDANSGQLIRRDDSQRHILHFDGRYFRVRAIKGTGCGSTCEKPCLTANNSRTVGNWGLHDISFERSVN